MYKNIFEQNLSKSFLYGTVAAVIIIAAMIMINPVMGYTLDAKLGTNKIDMFKDALFEMKNIKISDLPKDLKAYNATLIDPYGMPVSIRLSPAANPVSVAFVGTIQYKTPDGSTNMASTSFVPSITKISTDGTAKVYKLKQFGGPNGEMRLDSKGGSIHLEDITNPTND